MWTLRIIQLSKEPKFSNSTLKCLDMMVTECFSRKKTSTEASIGVEVDGQASTPEEI
jgi:hypothetical protein